MRLSVRYKMLHQLAVCYICLIWYFAAGVASAPINFDHYAIMQPNTTNFTRGFESLLQRVKIERPFRSFFLFRNQPADCVDEQLALNFELPFMQFDENTPVYVRGSGSHFMLAIVCVNKLTDKEFLQAFAKDLQHIRKRRILAIYNRQLAASAQADDIVTFFQHCQQLQFLNMVLIHRDFTSTHVYHSFNQFPEFELETRDLRATTPIFMNRFVNVRRKKLSILVDQIEPMTMLYRGETLIMEGYIGILLKTFARQYNFQLWLPDGYESTTERVLYMEEIRQAALNGSIDVGASLLNPQKDGNIHGYIYPIEFFQWVTMLPMEATLETYTYFVKIFDPAVLAGIFVIIWCICVVDAIQVRLACGYLLWNRQILLLLMLPWHLDMLRGVVCQSSAIRSNRATRRIIFMLALGLGGVLNSCFSTKLGNYFTVPPHQAPIVTFEQVAERNLQIQVAAPDIADIKFFRGVEFWKKHRHIFNIVKHFDEYQNNIRKLDTRYGYVMSSIAWPIIEERQKYFASPLFRLSTRLFYTKGGLLSLPVSENSLYRDLLSDFCLRSQETGLFDFWYKSTFFALVRRGRFNLKDPSVKYKKTALTVKSLESVWIVYCVGTLLSVLAFLFENAWHRRLQYWYKNNQSNSTISNNI